MAMKILNCSPSLQLPSDDLTQIAIRWHVNFSDYQSLTCELIAGHITQTNNRLLTPWKTQEDDSRWLPMTLFRWLSFNDFGRIFDRESILWNEPLSASGELHLDSNENEHSSNLRHLGDGGELTNSKGWRAVPMVNDVCAWTSDLAIALEESRLLLRGAHLMR